MKLFATLMLSMSMLVACGGSMEEPEPEAQPEPEAAAAPAEPTMTHPEIMQEIAATRPMLQSGIEGADGAAAAEAAMKLEKLFQSAVSEYESRGLAPAIAIATGAAGAAASAATAAEAGDFDAALAAHGEVQAACGGCHSQFREKTPDGAGYQFKTME